MAMITNPALEYNSATRNRNIGIRFYKLLLLGK